MEEFERLVTSEEACKALGISTSKFYRLCESGKIPGIKVGETWRLKASALKDIINRGTNGKKRKAS